MRHDAGSGELIVRLINTGPAYQFIPAARNQVFFIGSETTNIPTSAIYADGTHTVLTPAP